MTKIKQARIRWRAPGGFYHRKTSTFSEVLSIAELLLENGIPCTIAPIVQKPKILIPDQDAL
jgi:hypothetical protein